MKFNKLVRDKIPEIIKAQGQHPNFQILSEEKYLFELDRKLCEEMQEYQESKDLEELADMLDVIYAICQARGHSIDELSELQKRKCENKGAFSKKYFLISKESLNNRR